MVLLFEISTDFWWGKVVDRALRFFSGRHVPEEVWRDFSGLADVTRYRGAFGDIGLFVLHKPTEETWGGRYITALECQPTSGVGGNIRCARAKIGNISNGI